MTEQADLTILDAGAAAAALRSGGHRGFLGTDPVTQNDVALAGELTRLDATILCAGADPGTDPLVGFVTNPEQPRQVTVASTGADPAPLRALLDFLRTYRRATSFVALLPGDDVATAAFAGCGFTPAGTLREHRFRSGRYVDVQVWFARSEDPCPS